MLTEAQPKSHRHNPFDLTKVWPKAEYRLIEGRREGAQPLAEQSFNPNSAGLWDNQPEYNR
jgi:hypothetical protein